MLLCANNFVLDIFSSWMKQAETRYFITITSAIHNQQNFHVSWLLTATDDIGRDKVCQVETRTDASHRS